MRKPTLTLFVMLPLLLGGCGGGGGSAVKAPTIADAPQAASSGVGGSVTFRVAAKGGDLAYQWIKGAAPIAGATKAAYTVSPVTLDSAGTYAVRVTNPRGTVTSEGAALTVTSAPVIVDGPHDASVVLGSAATFSVTIQGDGPTTYQWTKDGVDIPGATGATYEILVAAEGDAGTYAVAVSNAYGSITSANATLTVESAPTITQPPHKITAGHINGHLIYRVMVGATGSTPLTYSWGIGDEFYPGLHGPSISYLGPGTYRVKVTNAYGSATASSYIP